MSSQRGKVEKEESGGQGEEREPWEAREAGPGWKGREASVATTRPGRNSSLGGTAEWEGVLEGGGPGPGVQGRKPLCLSEQDVLRNGVGE